MKNKLAGVVVLMLVAVMLCIGNHDALAFTIIYEGDDYKNLKQQDLEIINGLISDHNNNYGAGLPLISSQSWPTTVQIRVATKWLGKAQCGTKAAGCWLGQTQKASSWF